MMTGGRLLIGAATILAIAGLADAGEASFKGESATWWDKELEFKPEGLGSQEAVVRLARGGGEAVPVLVAILLEGEMTHQADSILTGLAIHDLTAAPALIKHLVPLCVMKHDRAFYANELLKLLVVANPDARSELRHELLRLLKEEKDSRIRRRAQSLLAAISSDTPEEVRGLLQLQLTGDADAGVISVLRSKGKELLPLLVEALPGASEVALLEIGYVLSCLEVPAAEIFDALLPAMKDIESRSAQTLSFSLIKKADADSVTFEHRRKLFSCLDDSFRVALIPKMEPDAKDAPEFAEFVSEVLSDESVQVPVRAMLIALVSEMKPDRAMPLLPHLIAGLSDPYPVVRLASAVAIGGIASAAKTAVPDLEKALQKEEVPEVRSAIEKALVKIRKK